MKILKHVEYKIEDSDELERLLNHLKDTTLKVDGVKLIDLYFPKGKEEFILVLDCVNEDRYLEWRDICPPPSGSRDWYEIYQEKEELFPNVNDGNIYPIKPEPTERIEMIFRVACSFENMDAKFGKTLTEDEDAIRGFILTQTPILGRIPTIEEVKEGYCKLTNDEVIDVLNRLDLLDVIHLNEDDTVIDAAYPFSGSKTLHKVALKKEGYKDVYAMCAIDALGICFMFDCDTIIESKCNHCEEHIKIEVKNNRITSMEPINSVVWDDQDFSCCAAISCCPNTNFFSSEQHFKDWQQKNIERKGNLLQIQDAFYLGKLFFENRINMRA